MKGESPETDAELPTSPAFLPVKHYTGEIPCFVGPLPLLPSHNPPSSSPSVPRLRSRRGHVLKKSIPGQTVSLIPFPYAPEAIGKVTTAEYTIESYDTKDCNVLFTECIIRFFCVQRVYFINRLNSITFCVSVKFHTISHPIVWSRSLIPCKLNWTLSLVNLIKNAKKPLSDTFSSFVCPISVFSPLRYSHTVQAKTTGPRCIDKSNPSTKRNRFVELTTVRIMNYVQLFTVVKPIIDNIHWGSNLGKLKKVETFAIGHQLSGELKIPS